MRRILLLFTVGALMMALATTTAFAQQEGESITATGELSSSAGPIAPAPDTPTFPLDTSGPLAADYDLIEGEGVDLDPYVGEQISIEGVVVQEGSQALPPKVRVDSVSSASGGGSGRNDIYGTVASEVLYGSYYNDLISGLEGDDLLVGEAGVDSVFGGAGDDFLVSGYAYFQSAPYAPASSDYVEGGPGNDLIDSADLAGAPDEVYCGPGGDLVYAGVEDFVAPDCEVVYRYFGF